MPALGPTAGARTAWPGSATIQQRLCLALALWNGRDPILKERAVRARPAPQGNHGEDVKEYWWYLDATPEPLLLNRWRYHYPQAAYPYAGSDRDAMRAADRYEPEYELLDTGVFDDDRYWIIEVALRQGWPGRHTDDRSRLTNAGPEADTVHVLPTVWFRNTWGWGDDEPRPSLRASRASFGRPRPSDRSVRCEILAGTGPDGADPELLFCENETNVEKLYGTDPLTPVPEGRRQRSRRPRRPDRQPRRHRHQMRILVPADRAGWPDGRSAAAVATPRIRATRRGRSARYGLRAGGDRAPGEADEFYSELTPATASADEAMVLRQACAGMLWSKQLFYFDVARWLDGDPDSRCRLSSAPRVGTRNG